MPYYEGALLNNQFDYIGATRAHVCQLMAQDATGCTQGVVYRHPQCICKQSAGEFPLNQLQAVCDVSVPPCSDFGGTSLVAVEGNVSYTQGCINGCSVFQSSPSVQSLGSNDIVAYEFSGGSCDQPEYPDAVPVVEEIPYDPTLDAVCEDNVLFGTGTETCVGQNMVSRCFTDGSVTPASTECVIVPNTPRPPDDACISGGAVCDGEATDSPPLPDDGTPGVPATPSLVVDYPEPGESAQAFYASVLNASGTTPTDGPPVSVGPPALGEITVNVEFPEDACFAGELCDEVTPAASPADHGSSVEYTDAIASDLAATDYSVAPGSPLPAVGDFPSFPSASACVDFSGSVLGVSVSIDTFCPYYDSYIRPTLEFVLWAFTVIYCWGVFSRAVGG